MNVWRLHNEHASLLSLIVILSEDESAKEKRWGIALSLSME